MLSDGDTVSWRLAEGIYGVDFSADGDGGTIEVSGSDCFKTPAMLHYRHRCDLNSPGQLIITNPTRFGLGKPISATVKVARLRAE
jgi:hypothetical protein